MNKEKIAQYILAVQHDLESTIYTEDRIVYQKCLAYVSVILAKVVLEEDVSSEVNTFDRLVSEMWLKDGSSNKKLYEIWQASKND